MYEEELKGVGGWLIVFIIMFTISISDNIYSSDGIFALIELIALIPIIMLAFVYKPISVTLTKGMLYIYIALSLMFYPVIPALLMIFKFVIWLAYFEKSERVKNTYLSGD